MSSLCNQQSDTSASAEFSVKIVVCDHYLTKPTPGLDVIYSDFRGSDIKQVPVLRIFGPTTDGHKTCLHIHGVFPYFYLPCSAPNPEPQLLYQVAASLDKALNIALKQASSTNQHVYKISLVKGLPFYGFHDKEHLYLKVFLYSPNLIRQAVELCSNGAILGQTFQPHESHLNFTLQFFIDFNLFGMSFIHLQKVLFRRTGISQNSNEPVSKLTQNSLKPESICFYEADCVASHIINRQRVGKGDGIENPGLEEVWKQELERRKQLNMSIASKSLSQGRLKSEETESHYKFEQIFLIKLSGDIDKPIETKNFEKLEQVYYPAESLEGTQLLDAVDVSMHIAENSLNYSKNHDETLIKSLDDTLVEDSFLDETIVDENVALNCSLSVHFSQVFLNNDDLDLVDMLQDMEEENIEKDSIIGTPADKEADTADDDDAEYSQCFNEETMVLEGGGGRDVTVDHTNESSPSWNDSFWESVNIPQLDGTFDDDHVKKVRKRKMRPLRLGLSKPKEKKSSVIIKLEENNAGNLDSNEIDEINVSRETVHSIASNHLRKSIKSEPSSIMENSPYDVANSTDDKNVNKSPKQEESLLDLVTKISVKPENIEAAAYDSRNNFMPEAGTSTMSEINIENIFNKNNSSDYCENTDSSAEEDLGIVSFYNSSKIFDQSAENNFYNCDKNTRDCQKKPHNCQSVIKTENFTLLTPKFKPPSKSYVMSSVENYNIHRVKNLEPFYSNSNDVGDKVEIGQTVLKIQSKVSRDQKHFGKVIDNTSIEEWRQLMFLQTNELSTECSKPELLIKVLAGNKHCVLKPILKAPTTKQIEQKIENMLENVKHEPSESKIGEITTKIDEMNESQALGLNDEIDNSGTSGYSQKGTNTEDLNKSLQITMQPDGSFLCFGSEDLQKNCSSSQQNLDTEVDFLTLMLAEVHTTIRESFHPDPAIDNIEAIFIYITNDCPPDSFLAKSVIEAFVVDKEAQLKLFDRCVFNINVTYVNDEAEIFEKVIELIKKHDPDIMCGYEIEMSSWGYFMERAQFLGIEIVKEVSRVTEKHRQKRWKSEDNEFEGRIIGRVTLNVWRLFRYELALSSYSFETCMYEILKERVPKYSSAQLAEWWKHESRMLRWIPVEYYMTRLKGTVRMLEKLDIINRTSELARLFGLQWWEVLSRGSQFRVESLMLRGARPLNLIALSPTVRQRAAMKAPECLPLIFEPESRFYADPVIVLDFQSLYPSMMIAYNYCFSTCIGRVQNINGESDYEFGAWRLKISKEKLEALVKSGLVHWSPVGVGFVKSSVRRGVLPAMLRRILAARQAVKKSMKQQTDESIKKAMHSRQLGLKLIANVTYGYTAANFSGRMPCVEVGDSVVAKGRETLERAIKLVRDSKQWNAKVVYGDTDSMFVQVPGATRETAFLIGQEIADAVTADNPSPVALKLEKVYQPCILQTKKRYVGFMYESASQEKPIYEAKGIETVRRDGCPASVKLLHSALCELFSTGDMSAVKRMVQETLARVADGTMPYADLMFTREYRGPQGYKSGARAPPAEIAKRLASRDARSVPRVGERVSWVVCAGARHAALWQLARAPHELATSTPPPHAAYYVTRAILPPLQRCLSLLGADVHRWWLELSQSRSTSERAVSGAGIARYLWRVRCVRCGAAGTRAVCGACGAAPAAARLGGAQAARGACHQICRSCMGHTRVETCEAMECPVYWRLITAEQKLAQEQELTAHLPEDFTLKYL